MTQNDFILLAPFKFPPLNEYVVVKYLVCGREVVVRVGFWTGSYFCYITNAPAPTAFSIDNKNMIAWKAIF